MPKMPNNTINSPSMKPKKTISGVGHKRTMGETMVPPIRVFNGLSYVQSVRSDPVAVAVLEALAQLFVRQTAISSERMQLDRFHMAVPKRDIHRS